MQQRGCQARRGRRRTNPRGVRRFWATARPRIRVVAPRAAAGAPAAPCAHRLLLLLLLLDLHHLLRLALVLSWAQPAHRSCVSDGRRVAQRCAVRLAAARRQRAGARARPPAFRRERGQPDGLAAQRTVSHFCGGGGRWWATRGYGARGGRCGARQRRRATSAWWLPTGEKRSALRRPRGRWRHERAQGAARSTTRARRGRAPSDARG